METTANPTTMKNRQRTLNRVRAHMVRILAGFAILRVLLLGSSFSLLVVENDLSTTFVGVLLFTGLMGTWIALTLIDQTTLASYGLIATLFLGSFTPVAGDFLQLIMVAVAISVLPTDRRVFVGLTLALFVVAGYQFRTDLVSGQSIQDVIGVGSLITILAAIVVTTRYYVDAVQQTISTSERSADLLRIAAEVGQITVGLTELDTLLPRAVNFIRDRLGYYHVQIFMLDDEGSVAWLRASTGERGEQLLARNHHLDVGSTSVIGRVTQTGEPVIARDTDRAGVYYSNELLPDTQAELALPIRDGERVIGALDVQSTRGDAFPPEDVRTLQILANLLAASIRNAQLFEEQSKNVQENQRLYIEAEANLREIQRLNQQLTRQSWDRYTTEQSGEQTGVELGDPTTGAKQGWTELLRQASQTRRPVSESENGRYTVAVPIILRGEVIGAMEIEPGGSLEENDTVEIMRAVSERLAVSLDNARLFEEAQETSHYEQRINNIVGRYQSLNSVDELLQVTLEELGETLGAKHGAIRLSADTDDDEDISASNGAASGS